MPRWLPVPLVCALTVVGATPAGAALTSSTVTSPATGSRTLATTTSTPVVVSGTAPGSDGDTINAYCYRGTSAYYVGQDTTHAGTYSITGTVPWYAPVGACLLRALPTIVGPDLSPFAGTWVIFEHQIDRLDGARRYDFDDVVQQDRGGTSIDSIAATPGAGGLVAPRLTDNAAQSNSADAFKFAGAFLQADLTIDGHPAYPPKQAEAINAAATGLPALQLTRSRAGTAGDATIAEQDPLVTCPGDPNPANGTNCTAFASSGVRWDRTTTTTADGTAYDQVDTLTSTDGAAHTAAVWLEYSAANTDAPTPSFGLSWVDGGARSVRTAGTQVGGLASGAPASLFMARDGTAADGDPTWPQAAVTWDPSPVAVAFTTAKVAAARFENLAIGAGGSVTLRTRYLIGTSAGALAAGAAAQRDAARPPSLTLSAPVDGTTSLTPSVVVAGTATDTERIASLSVAGRSVTPTADGSFSVTVPLQLGANAITAIATDGAGQTASATRTVSYRDTVAPALSGLTLSRARFRVARTPTATTAARRRPTPQGTTIRFTLGEAAPVTLAFTRLTSGRRSKGRCIPATPKLRHARGCTRTTAVGTLHRGGAAGANTVAFSGRIGTKALRPGSYRLTATAVDASGNTSRALTAAFTVVTR